MPQDPTKKIPPSRHMVWYREIVPATVPVIILGTACFFTLTLLQTHLSHSRSLSDSSARITRLEEELADLREKHSRQAVNWSEGLGRVVRRVRDLGREVHEFDDLKVQAQAQTQTQVGNAAVPVESRQQQQQEETRGGSLPARILAAFGGGGGASSSSPQNPTTTTTTSVAEAAQQSAARTASIASSLANTTFQKMDNLRETSSAALSNAEDKISTLVRDVQTEAHDRLTTLPDTPETNLQAAVRDTPGGATFAARLLQTFGNPQSDAQQTTAELTRLERVARETSVHDLAEKAQGAAHAVSTSMHDKFEVIADRMDPAAQLAAQKMDKMRETSGKVLQTVEEKVDTLVSDVQREAEERLRTLPATPETDLKQAVKQAPGGESFATRLLSTFGNPKNDTTKTTRELSQVGNQLSDLAQEQETRALHLAQDVASSVREIEHKVQGGLQELRTEGVKPLVEAASAKLDSLRTTTQHALSHAEQELSSSRLPTSLPRPVATADGTYPAETAEQGLLASRLIATFGAPSEDRAQTARDLARLKVQGKEVVERGQEVVLRPALERVEGVVQDVKGRMVDEGKKRWWS